MNTNDYGKTTAHKAYIQAQAYADQLAMSIMHHLNETEAFRNPNKDTWADVGTMGEIIKRLEEAEQTIREYCYIRAEED